MRVATTCTNEAVYDRPLPDCADWRRSRHVHSSLREPGTQRTASELDLDLSHWKCKTKPTRCYIDVTFSAAGRANGRGAIGGGQCMTEAAPSSRTRRRGGAGTARTTEPEVDTTRLSSGLEPRMQKYSVAAHATWHCSRYAAHSQLTCRAQPSDTPAGSPSYKFNCKLS